MNKLFKKFCGSINYNTYNNIEAALFSTGLTAGLANTIMNLNSVEDLGLCSLVSSVSFFSYLYFNYSQGENHTKDINEIKKLYFEFIHNYNKMNKDFGFDEPISIFTMFNYLYSNGYLSKDKKFVFSKDSCQNINVLYGCDVINGAGVCRHIASMFTDILNDIEIPAANVCCYQRHIDLDIEEVDFKDYSSENNIECIYKYIVSEENRRILIEKIHALEMNNIYVKITTKFVDLPGRRYTGNHLITFADYNDKSYYLDPTQLRIYRLNDKGNKNLYDEDSNEVWIRMLLFRKLNDLSNKEIYKLKKKIVTPNHSIPLDEEKEIISLTKNICVDNMDVFERFYSDNRELYNEISNKLVKIKKR